MIIIGNSKAIRKKVYDYLQVCHQKAPRL